MALPQVHYANARVLLTRLYPLVLDPEAGLILPVQVWWNSELHHANDRVLPTRLCPPGLVLEAWFVFPGRT
jgi:hypothetical protein